MLSEKEFIDGVWNKYHDYLQKKNTNSDFNKHYYKHADYMLAIRAFVTFMLALTGTCGLVYAGVVTYNFIQKETKTDFIKNANYDYSQNMIYSDGIYYKKVLSYEEYLECKEIWNGLVDMQEKDFEENFVIITAVENSSMLDLHISNIQADETTLYIEMSTSENNETFDKNNTVISSKISNELNRENIVIKRKESITYSTEYINIENLPEDYTKEQAVQDNCFVLENNKIISNNTNQLNDFIEKTKNNEKAFIRIVTYYNFTQNNPNLVNYTIITDIEYNNGKYTVCQDCTRRAENPNIYYREGNRISSIETNLGKFVTIEDEFNNQVQICCIQ